MLVYVRPSNEALLRARVPEAQGQRGCPSHPFHRARSASKEGTWPLPPHPSEATLHFLNDRYHQSSIQARSYPLQGRGLNWSSTTCIEQSSSI